MQATDKHDQNKVRREWRVEMNDLRRKLEEANDRIIRQGEIISKLQAKVNAVRAALEE